VARSLKNSQIATIGRNSSVIERVSVARPNNTPAMATPLSG
jgi:hypothetical protein